MLELQSQPYDIVIHELPQDHPPALSEPVRYSHTITIGEYLFVHKVVQVFHQGQMIASCLFSSDLGVGAHEHSAVTIEQTCFIAVAQFVFALELPHLNVQWKAAVDPSECFGVYVLAEADGLITHGEQDIARLAFDGTLIWSASGKDIFSNGIALEADHVAVVDFAGERYQIDNRTGEIKLVQTKNHLISRLLPWRKPAG